MRLPLVLLSVLGFTLACAGGGAKDGETAAEALGGSDACDAYLACVTDVDPSGYASAAAAYGEGGTCWEDAGADGCSDACDAARAELAEDNPLSDVCGGAGYPEVDGCPFVEGEWSIYFKIGEDDCGWPGTFGGAGELVCRDAGRGVFDWEITDLPASARCTSDGLRFECEAQYGGGPLAWSGEFDEWQDEASGDWTYVFADCESVGTFDAEVIE